MPPGALVRHAQEALLLVCAISLPVLAVSAIVGLIIAALQAASQIQDPTLSHLPRLVAVVVVLAVTAPWMGQQIAAFAARVFALTVPAGLW